MKGRKMTDEKKRQTANILATLCQYEELPVEEKNNGCLIRLEKCPFPEKACTVITPYDWLQWMEKEK